MNATIDVLPIRRRPEPSAGGLGGARRYLDLRDRRLAAVLLREDEAEENGLDPFERITCRIHRRWLHQCISSPVHVVMITGHRWCRCCESAASVAVDELAGDIRVSCMRCGRPPAGRATRQIIRTCTASLAASMDPCGPGLLDGH